MRVFGRWGLRNAIALILLLVIGAHAQGGGGPFAVSEPVPVPNGDSGFVGSVSASFSSVPTNTTIYYTLDGSTPTQSGALQYRSGTTITISSTCTLRAVSTRAGNYSSEISVRFVRAKAPAPTLRLSPTGNLYPAGSLNFFPSINCSLSVVSPTTSAASQILYTLDGTSPAVSGLTYSNPIAQKSTATLNAITRISGYDDSDPFSAKLTLSAQLPKPVATPAGKSFSTKTLGIKLSTTPAAAVIRYTVDPKAPLDSTAYIAPADSIVITGKNFGDTVTLRAQATSSSMGPSPIMTEYYVYYPPVQAPTSSLPQGPFYDLTSLTLTSATTEAVVRYTLDGSEPTASSSLATGAITLTDSVTLKAVAFRTPVKSGTLTLVYPLRLTQPTVDKTSRQFVDSIQINLSAPCKACLIVYTLDGSEPTLKSPSIANPSTVTIQSAGATVLTAAAVKRSVMSPSVHATYTKTDVVVKLSTPTISPPGGDFHDTLWIKLSTTDTNAQIHYTTDGQVPTGKSPVSPDSIRIDASQTINAIAFPTRGKLDTSAMQSETYTLLPSKPTVDPAPTQSFQDSVFIQFHTSTTGGVIYWRRGDHFNLDSATRYNSGQPVKLDASTNICAVTITGAGTTERMSDILYASFDIYHHANADSLAGGTALALTDNFSFFNESSTPITAKLFATTGLVGFKNAEKAISLKTKQPGQQLKVVFTKPQDSSAALYKLVTGGVQLVSTVARVEITSPGDYFVGIDTQPPVITLVSQTAREGDSTLLVLKVTDNVLSPTCYLESPGIPNGKLLVRPDAGGTYSIGIMNPAATLKPLWFRTTALDGFNTARLPADPLGKISAPQAWAKLSVPPVLTVGKSDYPWDLAGFPVSPKNPMTWDQLVKNNSGSEIFGRVIKDSVTYADLVGDSSIRPGMGFWLGSTKPLASLEMTPFMAAESDSNGDFKITLRKGWNMITDPSLEKMYWPFSKSDGSVLKSAVKGLHAFDSRLGEYVTTDSLDPWKGYFVYKSGDADTTITLWSSSHTPAAPKASADVSGLSLSLDFGRASPLELSAAPWAEDGFGREDEPMLPALRPGRQAWSQRGQRRLGTDIVKFTPGEVARWQIVISDPGRDPLPSLPSAAPATTQLLRLAAANLPAGYQAWAIAEKRGLKFDLTEGHGIPASGLGGDTLTILVGPLAKLSAMREWTRTSASPPNFAFGLEVKSAIASLRLDLPGNAQLNARLLAVDGRVLAEIKSYKLGVGHYFLTMGRVHPGQIGILDLRISIEGTERRYSLKSVW